MLVVPDCISTLELSKLWMYKALQELDAELQQLVDGAEDEDAAAGDRETEEQDEA